MPSDLEDRIATYMSRRSLTVSSRLGIGTQGSVFACSILPQSCGTRNDNSIGQVAVKFHEREIAYEREVGVYLRLQDLSIIEVAGHMVPTLVHYDDDLLAIEMTIVSPPFCLDFGGAYLDQPPDYSEQTWADWKVEKSEAFEENWSAVEAILAEFRLMRIYIADVNPGNIRF